MGEAFIVECDDIIELCFGDGVGEGFIVPMESANAGADSAVASATADAAIEKSFKGFLRI